MVRKTSKILVFACSSVLLVLLAVAGFTQTRLFKESLRSTLYKVLDSNLNASAYIGVIKGNLVTGFSLDTLALYVNNAPFVEARDVVIHYDPLSFWNKRISIASLSIDHPSITLIKFRDGTWNIDRLAKKKSEADSSRSPWVIALKDLRITDGRFRLIDSTALGRRELPDSVARQTIDFSKLDIQKINVELSATISGQEQTASIKNISLVSPREGFTLAGLSGTVTHSALGAEVKNLVIATPLSRIELSAKASGVDVFTIRDLSALQFVPVQCSLRSSIVDAKDLQHFLPSLDFLRGSVFVDCAVEGEFGNIRVKRLETRFNHSKIVLKGTVSNLHRPDDLTLNVESEETLIQPSDVPALLPFFHIPDFGSAGPLTFDFQYVGKPLDFQTSAHVSMAAGNVTVSGGLNLTQPAMSYHVNFSGRDVKLDKFFSNPDLQSRLNFSGSIDGEGTSIADLHSTAVIALDSSSFNGTRISSLRGTIVAEARRLIFIDTLRSPKGDIDATATLDYASGSTPSYAFAGSFSHFDLAPIFRDAHYESDCSFSLAAHGSEFLKEAMNGSLSAQFLPSRFGTHSFDSSWAEVKLSADSTERKSLRIVSPIADVSLDGRFSYGGLMAMITSHIDVFKHAYYTQRALFDSSYISAAGEPHAIDERADSAGGGEVSTLQYSVRLKNLEPLAVFFGNDNYNAIGEIDGTVRGTADSLSADGSIRIHSGKYTSKSGLFYAESLSVGYAIDGLTRDSIFAFTHSPTLTLKVRAADVLAGESVLHNPSLDLTFHNRKAEYSVFCDVDSTMKVGVDGRAALGDNAYTLLFDTFSLWYQGYELDMTKQFSASIGRNGVTVDTAVFVHQDERLTLAGGMNFGGVIDAVTRLENFTVSNIYHFGTSPDFKSNALAFAGTLNARGSIKGTVKDPVIVCTLDASGVSYRGAEFGYVKSAMNYANKALDFSVELSRSPQSKEEYELLCAGSIPMDLTLDTASSRFSLPGMDMYLKARDFDISIIDPFIAQLDNMKGTIAGSIHCSGSLDDPVFDGGIELKDCAFLFPMNNMEYHAAGKVEFQGNRVLFASLAAQNLSEDYSRGKIEFGGYLTLKGFVPDEFHLTAKGELMVLREARRTSAPGVYGDLIAATGAEGLAFDGNYTSSRLSGSLFVKQASLTFPSTKENSNLVSSRYVNVVVVDDTSKPVRDTTLMGPNLFAFLRPKKDARLSNEATFLDGLGYDLAIQTDGIVQIRMIFNEATNEELFADLNGKLRLSKEGSDVRLIGTISVSDKSKYEFYKEFVASGTLRFTGKPDNPELDIKATYTGAHLKPETATQKESTVPTSEKVVVSLAITGTRYDPKVKIGLSTVDENGNETERTGDVESDAISFLLTSTPGSPGKFRDDLTSNDKQGIANSLGGSIGGSLISGLTNTLLSGMMMDFLRANSINAVSNIDIRYSGTSPDLRLSGVVGNAFWSFGGKVFNDINNANVTVQWSLGSLIQNENLRNFMFEVDRKVDPLETYDIRRPTSGARIYYRFAF